MSFLTFSAPCQIDLVEKKSRFIGLGYPCASLAEFQRHRMNVEDEYHDASHVTYAYRIKESTNIVIGMSDAGEPKGTAGRPIYNHVEGNHLINGVLFVVRYFGGIKLGTGGLVKAYGNTAKLLLQASPLVPFVERSPLTVLLPYAEFNRFEYQMMKFQAQIVDKAFAGAMRCQLMVPNEQLPLLRQFIQDAFPLATIE